MVRADDEADADADADMFRAITLFSRSFTLEVAMRIWDSLLLEGDVFIFHAALGTRVTAVHTLLIANFDPHSNTVSVQRAYSCAGSNR